VGETGETVLK